MRILNALLLFMFIIYAYGAHNGLAEAAHYQDSAGLDERPGQFIPSDLTFTDEKSTTVALKSLVERPAILMLTYYTCSHICPEMLGSFAAVLKKLPLEPGKDYTLITLSFDESDTPEDARSRKVNYLKATNMPFPEDAWKFLTGDSKNIRRLSEALGIRVKRDDHGFAHPEVLVFIAPGGKITRYLPVSKYRYGAAYPITFSEIDLATGIGEASQGKVSPATKKEPLYCFLHEPEQQKRFFSILKIAGAITLGLLLSLFLALRKGKASPERSRRSGK
jgi:protein SCO1/2